MTEQAWVAAIGRSMGGAVAAWAALADGGGVR